MSTLPTLPFRIPSGQTARAVQRLLARPARRVLLMVLASLALAGSSTLAATLTFSTSAPAAASVSISNFVGAAYDANNVGGSGTNADGSPNNGTTNDAVTCVASGRAAQGQTFTTGANPGGYTLTDITVQAAGYTSNTATGTNLSSYSLASTTANFVVRVGRISGTTFIPYTVEYAASGGRNNPGTGSSANGSGIYLTFTFKAPIVLQPNTTYAFDIGSTGDYFEMLGIRDAATGGNPYGGGTAYTSGASGVGGNTITAQAGDRVFLVNMTAYTPPAAGQFVHPGLLSTEADFERIRTAVAMGQEPWLSNYNALKGSWTASRGGWTTHQQATITRSSSLNDSSHLYQDIAVAYGSALCWKISGDTAYADQAVAILNAWGSTLTAIAGDTNNALNELYGSQFAAVAEIMRTYPGWAAADFAQFQTMIYNVFYPLAHSFTTGHFGTVYDHYWVNWDMASISTMYAIGVLNDNASLTTEATNYFYNGVGNGCIDRAVNYVYPGYLGQGQEMGRDQGHATLDIAQLAAFCQMAWNQGVDLFGYENNRVLSMAEYTARYNLGQDVPFVPYSYTTTLLTTLGSGSRGANNTRPGWPTLYHHYVNLKGMAAPYTKQMSDNMGTAWYYNGDTAGWDALTAALPPIAAGASPGGLTASVTAQQPVLSWWGSAYATSYNVLRSSTSGSGYTPIATGLTANTYTDTAPLAGTNYYVVVGNLPGGSTTGNSNEAGVVVGTSLYSQLKFDDNTGTTAADATGNGWNGTFVNGPTWVAGKTGATTDKAVKLTSSSSQYVSLPAGMAGTLTDFTVAAWVNLASNSAWARLFDFGTPNPTGSTTGTSVPERYMFLVPQNGGGVVQFSITGTGSPAEQQIKGTAPLPTGQWVHVAVSLNGQVGTLYVNGVAVGANANVYFSPNRFPPTTANYIGKSAFSADPYLNGTVDDFRIYRGALSTGAIYTLATSQTPPAPPAAPAGLTVTALAGGSMQLNWSASSGATSYTVSRATSPNGPFTVVAALVSGTTYTDTGLTTGTTYYYRVDAANNGGDGTYSTPANAVALPPIPGTPGSLVATAASASSVGLVWTAASNVATYNVKRALASGGPYTTVAAGLTATTYTDTGLTNGTNYYYVVSAVNAAGEGANSNESSAAPTSLLMQLKFDQSSGATAWDGTGHGWNATAVNGPTWTAGKFGNAITLASASSQYLTIPSGVVSGLGDFTISVWVNPATVTNWMRVFDFGTGTTNYMFLTVANGSNAKLRFGALMTGTTGEQQINTSVVLTAGVWTHLAVTLSGSTGTLYVNGTAVGTNSAMTFKPSSLGNTTLNYIGKSQFADPYLNGSVDDFRIYTRALSASEVAAIASSTPAQPQGVTAVGGYQQVALSWNPVAGATSYTVRASTASGGQYATVASGLTSPGVTLTGLTAGTTYYYVVAALNATGEGPNSAEAAGGALATPGAPTSVIVTPGHAVALVTWTPLSSATSYSVYRSDSVGTSYVLVASGLTGTSYFDTGLTDGYTYYYVVTGSNAGGEGPSSALSSATPLPAPVISSAASAGAFYGSAFSYAIAASNSPTSYAATGLPPGLSLSAGTGLISGTPTATGTYHATISASNAGGTGSAPLTITVQTTAPSTPTGLTAKQGSATVILNWSAASGASGYNVKRSLVSGGPYTVAGNVGGLNYTDTGLTNGTTYYYVVSAVSSIGESANSSQVSATPAAAGADWFTQLFSSSNANSTSNTSFTFTPSTNGNKYVVSRRTGVTAFPTSTTGATAIAGGDDTSTAVTLSGTAKVSLYGVSYSTFYVGSNGYITFTSDTAYSKSIANHFKRPRISALFEDLDSSSQGAMSWVQLADRVAVTWLNIPEYGKADSNNFQVEMFFDGRIRITCLGIGDAGGLIGLSGVTSTPTGFVQSTFSNYPAPLAAPGSLTATGNNGVIALRWNDSSGATSYNVKRSLTSGSGYTTMASGLTSPAYTDNGLINGTTYYYVVSAVNALVGEGIDSTEVGATPQSAPPAPTSLTTVLGGNLVGLNWNASAGATRYTVWRSATSGSGYTMLATLNGTGFIDGTAASGATYYYMVTGSNDTGTSANSAEAVTTLPPSAPTGLSAAGGNAAVVLAWSASGGAVSYTVYRASGSGTYLPLSGGTTASTGYTDTAVTNGTTYNYMVTATNAGGSSVGSTAVSATPSPPISAAETAAPALSMSGTGAGTSVAATVKASVPGHRYQLQYVDDLAGGAWTNVGSPQAGTGNDLTLSVAVDTTSVPRRFYRVLVQQP